MVLAVALCFLGFSGPVRVSRAPSSSVNMYAGMAKAVTPEEANSFVQTEMRGAAMALHTKQQAPKEGKAEAKKVEQTPVESWQPGKAEYLQFLVDSRHVYSTMDELIAGEPTFASFRESGLERAEPLERDIAWFADEHGIAAPSVAPQGETYAKMLREMVAAGEKEAFVCHFCARPPLSAVPPSPPTSPPFSPPRAHPHTRPPRVSLWADNTYFAHTAGGRMIGKRMSDMVLDGHKLHFYQWEGGNVDKELLPGLRKQIDALADTWTREQKDMCLGATADSFKYGGALLQHISRPNAAAQPA